MGSIFCGLTQVGAWGCFDEFNRINIEVLSVVSAQLRAIQNALNFGKATVDIGTGREMKINSRVGIFVTMNPGYAGRTELPDNLKALFRPVTMIVPDFLQICEIMLFSEGFEFARNLAKKMTTLYKLASEQLSKQHHYDFGLRALKVRRCGVRWPASGGSPPSCVLQGGAECFFLLLWSPALLSPVAPPRITAATPPPLYSPAPPSRAALPRSPAPAPALAPQSVLVMAGSLKREFSDMSEDLVLMRSLRDSNLPKFVYEDVPLFKGLIEDLFPGLDCPRVAVSRGGGRRAVGLPPLPLCRCYHDCVSSPLTRVPPPHASHIHMCALCTVHCARAVS
jgi:hypothetical protein